MKDTWIGTLALRDTVVCIVVQLLVMYLASLDTDLYVRQTNHSPRTETTMHWMCFGVYYEYVLAQFSDIHIA